MNNSHREFQISKAEAVRPVVLKSVMPEMNEILSEARSTFSNNSSV